MMDLPLRQHPRIGNKFGQKQGPLSLMYTVNIFSIADAVFPNEDTQSISLWKKKDSSLQRAPQF